MKSVKKSKPGPKKAPFWSANSEMYCLQWLIPVLLIPKPVNPALLYNHVVFMILYLASFFIERKPCTICSLVFIFALILICTSGYGNCLFWHDEEQCCPREETQGMWFEKSEIFLKSHNEYIVGQKNLKNQGLNEITK